MLFFFLLTAHARTPSPPHTTRPRWGKKKLNRLVAAICGFILITAGQSALQSYINTSKSSGEFWAPANLARLGPGSVLRLSWWIWFFVLCVCVVISLAFASAVIAQARVALVAWSAIAAVLSMMAANTMLDIVSQRVSTAHDASARCAAAGYIITAISFLALCYNIGLDHSKAPN